MPAPTLITQTTYAELLERCAANAFSDAFPEKGAFISKEIKGRRYWYFQLPAESGRVQRYMGPETPELLERISHHKEARNDERERSALVSSLVRQGMPRPPPEIGNVIAALARAGLFRLRCVLVGTVAYQTYSAMLGKKLPSQSLQTGDIDIAQFASTSDAIADQIIPVFEILKEVDKTFRAVPNIARNQKTTSYQAQGGGLRVDFLTPNEGRDTDEPQLLSALQTHAQPLRFLDFLIHDAQPAVALHGSGVYVTVPRPERYAVHKLIVAQRRTGGVAKRDKDIQQAAALLTVLAQKQPKEIRLAWEETEGRGRAWQKLLLEGMSQLPQLSRDLTLKASERVRSIVPKIDLTFQNPPPRYVFDRDVIVFDGEANGERVQCAISRETLEDHFDANGLPIDGRIAKFLENRTAIEAMARKKYLTRPIEQPGAVLIKTLDVPALRRTKSASRRENS